MGAGAAGGGLRFWDSSALVALAVLEPSSGKLETLLRRDSELALWWGAPLEGMSVLLAAQKQERISPSDFHKARLVLEHLRMRAYEIQPSEEVRARALRILSLHPLRVAAAWELAAALIWCRERTNRADFVSVDEPLRLAAVLEGFRVLPYADEVHEPDPDL
ncbi:MAG TPA: PIN domain-containing protein [Thermoanaerobaculia bacterium]|nr:PIN domain-containing protein [Thermoanaerobaculia bacterium]